MKGVIGFGGSTVLGRLSERLAGFFILVARAKQRLAAQVKEPGGALLRTWLHVLELAQGLLGALCLEQRFGAREVFFGAERERIAGLAEQALESTHLGVRG